MNSWGKFIDLVYGWIFHPIQSAAIATGKGIWWCIGWIYCGTVVGWYMLTDAIRADLDKEDSWIITNGVKVLRFFGRLTLLIAYYLGIYFSVRSMILSQGFQQVLAYIFMVFLFVFCIFLMLGGIQKASASAQKGLGKLGSHALEIIFHWLLIRPLYYLFNKRWEPPKKEKKKDWENED